MYADGTVLLCALDSLDKTLQVANNELPSVNQWFKSNKLNTTKMKYIIFTSSWKAPLRECHSFSPNHNVLERVSSIQYLCVTLDEHLHWKPHIALLYKKLSRACIILYKCRYYFDTATPRAIYFSIFHSHLSYCIASWGYTYVSYVEHIVLLQKRA